MDIIFSVKEISRAYFYIKDKKSFFFKLIHFNNKTYLQMPDIPGIRKADIIILKIIEQK